MDSIGLWGAAASSPDRAAVIEPAGHVASYAELAAAADRYGRGSTLHPSCASVTGKI